jgi:hypothetical protein
MAAEMVVTADRISQVTALILTMAWALAAVAAQVVTQVMGVTAELVRTQIRTPQVHQVKAAQVAEAQVVRGAPVAV